MQNIGQIRQAYEENYQKIIDTITAMGGENRIKEHRQKQSTLYRQLRDLQRREHYLNELENRFSGKLN